MGTRIELSMFVLPFFSVYVISVFVKERKKNTLNKISNPVLCPTQDERIKEVQEFIKKHKHNEMYDSDFYG